MLDARGWSSWFGCIDSHTCDNHPHSLTQQLHIFIQIIVFLLYYVGGGLFVAHFTSVIQDYINGRKSSKVTLTICRWSGTRRRWWPWWEGEQQTGKANWHTGGCGLILNIISCSLKTESGAPLYLHKKLGNQCQGVSSWNNSTQATEGRRNLC